jgi:osmotically-inducible protein OsmY
MKQQWNVVGIALGLTVLSALQGCVPILATGVVAGAMIVGDRRTSGTVIDDEGIENKAILEAKRKFSDGTHLNITSFNRVVLLTGEVFNEEQKKGVEAIVRAYPNVKEIHNELQIAPVASLGSVSGDSALTARIKGRMVDTKDLPAVNVKVVTEKGVVYLMGIVTRAESELATTVARTTSGVQRVVRLFEYQE